MSCLDNGHIYPFESDIWVDVTDRTQIRGYFIGEKMNTDNGTHSKKKSQNVNKHWMMGTSPSKL